MDPTRTASIEELLAQRAWVRALARAVARDPDRADDVEQEAWARALESPPAATGSLRGWFARVVRSVAIDAARSEGRRSRREAAMARHEAAVPSASEVVAEADAHRQVVEAAFALSEPYRAAVLLRFFQGLPLAEVARATRVPEATARTRIRRALAQLRRRLERDHGDRWMAVLLPLLAGGDVAPGAIRVAWKATSVKVAAVVVAAASLAVVIDRTRGGAAAPAPLDAAAVAAGATRPRHGATPGEHADPAVAPAATGTAVLFGRVRTWADDAPAAWVALTLRRPGRPGFGAQTGAKTGADGVFRFAGLEAADDWRLAAAVLPYATIDVPGLAVAAGEVRDVGTLWLAEPGRIEVEVVDSRGAPLVGASVAAHLQANASEDAFVWERARRGPGGPSTGAPACRTGTADAEGRAVLSDLIPGAYAVSASARGLAPAAVEHVAIAPGVAPPRVRLVLVPGHSLAGRVLDERDEPVAGVELTVHSGDPWGDEDDTGRWHARRFTTDATGAYRFDDLPPVRARLRVAPPGRAPFDVPGVVLPHDRPFDVVLPACGSVRGRVTDEAGTAIAGAEVSFEIDLAERSAARTRAITDRDGRYDIAGVPAGPVWRLRVRAPGFAERCGASWEAEPPSCEAVVAGHEEVWDFVMHRGASADVRVVGSDERPLFGVQVCLKRLGQDSVAADEEFATTDEDGIAHVEGLVRGGYVVAVRADGLGAVAQPEWWWRHAGYPAAFSNESVLRVEGPAEVLTTTLRLSSGSAVQGRVVDHLRRGVAGAAVTIPGRWSSRPVVTDIDGRWRADGVAPSGACVATAVVPGHGPGASEAFVVPASGAVEGIEIAVAPCGAVAGSVRSTAGIPLVGAVVRWSTVRPGSSGDPDWWATRRTAPSAVAADGSFVVEGVGPGPITIVAEAQDHVGGWLVADVGPGQLARVPPIDLQPAARLRGRVVAADGRPVPRALVRADSGGSNWPRGTPMEAQADDDGAFELHGVSQNAKHVTASAPGHATAELELTADANAAPVEIRLGAAARITGRVVTDDGRGIGGVHVSTTAAETWSAADGTFLLADVPEGLHDVDFAPPTDARESFVGARRTAIASGASDLVVALTSGLTISGRVVDETGAAVSGAWVQAHPVGAERPPFWDHYTAGTYVSPDGRFRIAGLSTGHYQVRAREGGGGRDGEVADVVAGASDVEVLMRRSCIWFRVLVREEAGTGGPFCMFETRPAGSDAEWATVQSNMHLGAGVHLLQVASGGWPMDLRATANARPPVLLRHASDREEVTLTLPRGMELRGVVVDARGAPVWKAAVDVALAGDLERNARAVTDTRGQFSFAGLDRAPMRVAVRAPGLAVRVVQRVAAGTRDLVVRLDDGEVVRGTVVGADGFPRSDVRVIVLDAEGTALGAASTDAAGGFAVEHVPLGGRWRIDGPPGTEVRISR